MPTQVVAQAGRNIVGRRRTPEHDRAVARPRDAVDAMNRRFRGTGIAFHPLVLLVVLAAVTGCVPSTASPTVPPLAPTATPRLPTPVPTIPSESVDPGRTDPPPSAAGLVIRLTTCSDACGPVAGTTIMDDGQIIWQDADGRVLEARLTPAGLASVRDRIDDLGALARDGNYQAKPRPGKEPLPRGTTSYRFEVKRDGVILEVTSGEPADFASERDLWIIPPEMVALAAFAAQLNDPETWLGADALAEPARAYAPARYLVVVDLHPAIGAGGEILPDVDEVDWPIGKPIEGIGAPVGPGEDAPAPRCLIVDARTAAATTSAEAAVGVVRDLRQWSFTIEYAWRRADGLVQVTLLQLLPHETGPCAQLVLTPP